MTHDNSSTRTIVGVVACAAFALLASACSTSPSTETAYAGDPANGAVLADRLCSGCHSIAPTGASPRSDAPPLRDVLADYPPNRLATDLQKAAHISFLQMPQFHLGEHGGADLVAYIQGLEAQ